MIYYYICHLSYDCAYVMYTSDFVKRFGVALVPTGTLQLKHRRYADDFEPIDRNCRCMTCSQYTRAYLHTIVTQEPVACSLITIHNVAYQVSTKSRK